MYRILGSAINSPFLYLYLCLSCCGFAQDWVWGIMEINTLIFIPKINVQVRVTEMRSRDIFGKASSWETFNKDGFFSHVRVGGSILVGISGKWVFSHCQVSHKVSLIVEKLHLAYHISWIQKCLPPWYSCILLHICHLGPLRMWYVISGWYLVILQWQVCRNTLLVME